MTKDEKKKIIDSFRINSRYRSRLIPIQLLLQNEKRNYPINPYKSGTDINIVDYTWDSIFT